VIFHFALITRTPEKEVHLCICWFDPRCNRRSDGLAGLRLWPPLQIGIADQADAVKRLPDLRLETGDGRL